MDNKIPYRVGLLTLPSMGNKIESPEHFGILCRGSGRNHSLNPIYANFAEDRPKDHFGDVYGLTYDRKLRNLPILEFYGQEP